MSFSRVKVSGWAFGEVLTSAQMNALDEDHAEAIDGVGGGTYTVTAPLTIEGDNVNLCTDGADICSIGGGATNTLIVNAATDFQRGVNVSAGSSSIAGAVSFASSGSVTLQGPTTVADPMTLFGDGRLVFRPPGTINNANGSLVVTTTNFYQCAAATLSADRVWTINDTGAVDGDWIIVKNFDAGFTITINSPAAVNLGNLREGTSVDWALVMRVSGVWTQRISGS